jgi:hypothetical protein
MCDFPPILQNQACIFPDRHFVNDEEAMMIETPETIIASQMKEIDRLNGIIRSMQEQLDHAQRYAK